MAFLLAYLAVAAAFYLAGAAELRRARTRERIPRDTADHVILHLVAALAALLWAISLPVLLRAAVRRVPSLPRLPRPIRPSHERANG